MKKIYKAPEILVVKTEIRNYLCQQSIALHGSYNGTSAIESRRGILWDDEEEDE